MGFATLYPSYDLTALQFRQIHFGIVSLAFDVLGDDLLTDYFAALLLSNVKVGVPRKAANPAVQSHRSPDGRIAAK